ncbi:hypothetical protein SBA3_900010 [Candidatus Sulfopaludibacter sp. SbA3]|nr:hypothetical protein SBA3_900010 [Candidatus Sulfopaludibacter sp. SbA3]
MSAPRPDSDDLAACRAAEERWRARVSAAKVRFDLAVAEVARALQEPGNAAVERALEVEAQARAEYMRDLQIFTDMIVRGKMPGDETTE